MNLMTLLALVVENKHRLTLSLDAEGLLTLVVGRGKGLPRMRAAIRWEGDGDLSMASVVRSVESALRGTCTPLGNPF